MKKIIHIALCFLFVSVSCGGKQTEVEDNNISREDKTLVALENQKKSEIINEDIKGTVRRINVKNLGALSSLFNDSNYLQLQMAQRLGIKPIIDLPSSYFTGRPLIKITDTEYYKLDSLTHSLPYLVPEAAGLLNEIGKRFRDSLESRGGDSHIIKVTSLLRTPESVERLRRVNINATDSSTHQYATTFDISYVNFCCTDSDRLIYQGDLKNLLAEVLQDLRQENRCYVKYERKTGCFHITVIN